eukprot:5243496-Amphidinium_carterae.2
MQKHIADLERQLQCHPAAPPPPPARSTIPLATAAAVRGNGSANDIAELHNGLTRLATIVHTCWTKQQVLGETNNVILTQLLHLRQRCDYAAAAAAWSSPMPGARS